MLRNLDYIQNLMESYYKILRSWPAWCKLHFSKINSPGKNVWESHWKKQLGGFGNGPGISFGLDMRLPAEMERRKMNQNTLQSQKGWNWHWIGGEGQIVEWAWLLFLTWYLGGFYCPLPRKTWWEASLGWRWEFQFGDSKFDIACRHHSRRNQQAWIVVLEFIGEL